MTPQIVGSVKEATVETPGLAFLSAQKSIREAKNSRGRFFHSQRGKKTQSFSVGLNQYACSQKMREPDERVGGRIFG